MKVIVNQGGDRADNSADARAAALVRYLTQKTWRSAASRAGSGVQIGTPGRHGSGPPAPCITAMDGDFRLVDHFADGDVQLNQLGANNSVAKMRLSR